MSAVGSFEQPGLCNQYSQSVCVCLCVMGCDVYAGKGVYFVYAMSVAVCVRVCVRVAYMQAFVGCWVLSNWVM